MDHVNLKQFADDLNSALAIVNQRDFGRNCSAVLVQIVIWEGADREPYPDINGDIVKLKEVCVKLGYVVQERFLPADARLAQRRCLIAASDLTAALSWAFHEAEKSEGLDVPNVPGIFYHNGYSVDNEQGIPLWL